MPQDSAYDHESSDLAVAARRLLEEAASEPVPDKLIELARKLEDAIAEKLRDGRRNDPELRSESEE
jgi:hypothetical protein